MTLNDVVSQIYSLTKGHVNGEVFTQKRLNDQLRAMLRKENDQYIFEVSLPDGDWFVKAIRRGNMYDYYVPDTRKEEQRYIDELFGRVSCE